MEFHPFARLPVEIQLQIWQETATATSVRHVRAAWANPAFAIWAPIVDIPSLGDGEWPGLIPYELPDGAPPTIEQFPFPHGLPAPMVEGHADVHFVGVDRDTYNEYVGVGQTDGSSGAMSAIRSTLGLSGRRVNRNQSSVSSPAALLSVCRESRRIALGSCIQDTKKAIPLNPSGATKSAPFITFGHGTLMGAVFVDSRTRKPCFVYMIGRDALLNTPAPPPGHHSKLMKPGPGSHVAAWLSDIEKCIFGHRLSLTKVAEGFDEQHVDQLSWAKWWRPELGHRARRPEADHPFYYPPEGIISIYASILHALIPDSLEESRACLADNARLMWSKGSARWYSHFVQTGGCKFCAKPLMGSLSKYYPEMLDSISKGFVDVVLLMSRDRFENTERTYGERRDEGPLRLPG